MPESSPSSRDDTRADSAPDPDVTITLLIPTLNELHGLRMLLPGIDRSLFDDILVIDGGSTDGTVAFAEAEGLRVERQKRPGLAFGVFDAIAPMKTSHVIEFSPDGNCKTEHLAELVEKLRQGYDLVTVSRYLPPAVSADDTPITAFGNFMFTRLIRMLGKFPVTDSLGIFRGYRCDVVRAYDFEHYLAGPVLEPLVTGICCIHGLKIAEIPGDEPARVGGASKMSVTYNGSYLLLMVIRLYVRKFLGIKI